MIVDIQGVGDLWTDPQVHCALAKKILKEQINMLHVR